MHPALFPVVFFMCVCVFYRATRHGPGVISKHGRQHVEACGPKISRDTAYLTGKLTSAGGGSWWEGVTYLAQGAHEQDARALLADTVATLAEQHGRLEWTRAAGTTQLLDEALVVTRRDGGGCRRGQCLLIVAARWRC